MNILERIKELAKSKDISIYQLEEEIKIGRNTIYQWNKRTPSAEKLEAVANYFNVSIDYLLGRTDNPSLDQNKKDEVAALFRINTANMDPDTVEEIEEELKNYSEFLIQKALEKKARRNKK
ncbi:helix-turn-helix domain-containing protein [Enterococcus faecium]|uniref:helix-turn-helix domain-containing protein n=1 Tax=Enterococcus faecium TaxID=1352 RepID=UPI0034E95011